MKKMTLLAVSAAVLALSACSTTGNNATSGSTNNGTVARQPQTFPTAPIPAPNAASSLPDQQFTCRNGMTLTVKHNVGTDRIRLFVDTMESSAILSAASAGSGVRYVNQDGFYNRPTEFHFKGNEGVFSFQDVEGNKVSTTCKAKAS